MLCLKNVEDSSSALLEFWCTIYTVYAKVMWVNHESAVSSDDFRRLASHHGIVIHSSVIESRNSLEGGERYHAPLRGVFSLVRLAHPPHPP